MEHLVVQEVEHWLGKVMVGYCPEGQLGFLEGPDNLKRYHSGGCQHFQRASLSSACCVGLQHPCRWPWPKIIVVNVYPNNTAIRLET